MRVFLLLLCNLICMTLFAQIRSVRSGNWSDAATWGGKTPGPNDKIIIEKNFIINYDVDLSTVSGIDIIGTLSFDPARSATLQSSKNVHVTGLLVMKPSSAQKVHTLRFVGVNENNFIGDGMKVLESDIGLWVTEMGVLQLVGTSKSTGWTNSQTGIGKGVSSFSVKKDINWQAGDEIVITPTETPNFATYLSSFDEATISSVSGKTIVINKGTAYHHPVVNNLYSPEILNVTRNVRIEGTPEGRSHILSKSMKPQEVRWVQIRYMGPRKDRNNDNIKDMVPGRYGLHFHHMMDGSRGTVVEGVVIRDCGNHSYVPHMSHGITMKNNISYNTMEDAFWWDPTHITHDLMLDGNIVAKAGYVKSAKGLNVNAPGMFTAAGFLLGMGQGNVAVNNVVTGSLSLHTNLGGSYVWEADNEGVWEFKNNITHNSTTGIRMWQNTALLHTVDNYSAYNNTLGIYHGAYVNNTRYVKLNLYANAIELKASSMGDYSLRFEEFDINGGGYIDHGLIIRGGPVAGSRPTLYRGGTIKNYKKAAVLYDVQSYEKIRLADFVLCNLGTKDFIFTNGIVQNDKIRVQPASGTPFQITSSGRTNISPFAPTTWGQGRGLKAEFFNETDLSNLVHTEKNPVVHEFLFNKNMNYRVTDRLNYSIRWSGFIMPQISEPVTFQLRSAGGHRLWVDGKLIFDSWGDKPVMVFNSQPVQLKAGVKYSYKLEYFNTNDTRSALNLKWSGQQLPLEIIPESQLYYGDGQDNEQPPVDSVPPVETDPPVDPQDPGTENIAPVANAGIDRTINLPAVTVNLIGDQSNDPDGRIVKYEWKKLSGSSQAWIENPNAENTRIRNLAIGTYVMELTITDDKNKTVSDQMTIKVLAKKTEVSPSSGDVGLMDKAATITSGKLTIYPNPARNSINISYTDDYSGKGSIRIYSNSGKLVRKMTFNKTTGVFQQPVDISSFKPGIYHIEVMAGDEVREVKEFFKN